MERLRFHTWRGVWVIAVLALVLGETFVESQYYMPQLDGEVSASSRSNYYFYDDQAFFPGEEVAVASAFQHPADSLDIIPKQRTRRSAKYSEEDEDDEDDDVRPSGPKISVSLPEGRSKPVKLPKGFNDRVNKRIKMSRRSKVRLHGDPDPIDEEDEDGRRPEGRLLWPFSIEITKGQKDKGWGGPGGYGSSHPPPRTGLGFGLGVNNHNIGFDVKHGVPPKQHARIGFTKGHFPGHHHHHNPHDRAHFSVSGGYGPQNGWGWDAFIEHEKHRLKYEILKLKAKKKIAVLQNKVELKKLFSMLLQKKIQALEWW